MEAQGLADRGEKAGGESGSCGSSWMRRWNGIKTEWVWTKGHASHSDNNRADELASRAAREQAVLLKAVR